MTDFYFAEHLLLRMPAESWQLYDENLQLHLDKPHFRTAIFIASPQFYSCLDQKNFIFANLSPKEQLTLAKYVNRWCFRPTPFGLFSSVSLVKWGDQTAIRPLPFKGTDFFAQVDHGLVLTLSRQLREFELSDVVCYTVNPSLYRLMQEYRFISINLEDNDLSGRYLLQSTEYSAVLKGLAALCETPRPKQEIVRAICQLAACAESTAIDYFEFLKDEQVLVDSLRPNITGPDHLLLLLSRVKAEGNQSVRTLALNRVLPQPSSNRIPDAAYFSQLDKLLRVAAGETANPVGSSLNVTLNRELEADTLDVGYQAQLRDALFALECLAPDEPVPAMQEFAQNFQKDFERQGLSLLYALDPEVGIGYYGNIPPERGELSETLGISVKRTEDNSLNWTKAHRFLLNKWHQSVGERKLLRVEEAELKQLTAQGSAKPLLGFSVLFRVIGEQIFVESAGGVNPAALFGRFTVADSKIADAARQMAAQLEAANPHIMFAEVSHLSGTRTGNVNRRETIWSYEIPLTAASTLPVERQLALNDLSIMVEYGQVFLFSKKHQKVVIPRLTSAYNHMIDQLPVFRFLADLAYQYGRHSWGIDLQHYFPGLNFYPQVAYKQTILCPATWVLDEKDIDDMITAATGGKRDKLYEVVSRLGLPANFSLAEGDQQLVFFSARYADLLFFANCIRGRKEAVLKEYFLAEPGGSLITDATGVNFANQFNACVLPGAMIGQVPRRLPAQATEKIKRKLMPGSEWLYLKIYTSRIGSKRLLLKILPLLRRRYAHAKVSRWFFVRYEDQSSHLRLRMQIDPKDVSAILTAFKKALEDGVTQHVIREYQIDVYHRELERYQRGGMILTEDFFWASSELAVQYLKPKPAEFLFQTFQVAFRTVLDIVRCFSVDALASLRFVEESYQQFIPEFEARKLKIELDRKYRELQKSLKQVADDDGFYRAAGLLKSGRQFMRSLTTLASGMKTGEGETDNYLRSIIHMHLNRLFINDARKQEMITYYLLYKFLLSERARDK
jgi:thiopeptide-type bacteriocin biosynthesis protein